MDRVTQYKAVHSEALDLFKRKNADYGDAFANYGPVGVIVRMGDKINRLSSVTKNQKIAEFPIMTNQAIVATKKINSKDTGEVFFQKL